MGCGASHPRLAATDPAVNAFLCEKEIVLQQLPPFPEEPAQPPEPAEPSTPGSPTHAPSETPPVGPDVDVPAPSQPGTDPSPTPISPTA